ncbi:MAG: amino acid permease [Sphingomicrobium sp.]
MSALPNGGSDDKAPLIDLGRWLAGSTGAIILTLAAIASLTGNLHSIMTSTSRVTFALGVRGDLPAWFARIHRLYDSPHNSIAFLALLAGALAIAGTYVWLAVISVLARLIIYAATIGRSATSTGARPGVLALYALGVFGILLCGWGTAQATAEAWRMLALLGLAGSGLYVAARLSAKRYAATVSATSSSAGIVVAITPPPSSRSPS